MSVSFLQEEVQKRMETEKLEDLKQQASIQELIRNSPFYQRMAQPTPAEIRLDLIYYGFDVRWIYLGLWAAFSMALSIDCFLFSSWFLRNMTFNLYPLVLISLLETIAVLFTFMKVAEVSYGLAKVVFERLKKVKIHKQEKTVLQFSTLSHRDISLRTSIVDSFDFGDRSTCMNTTDSQQKDGKDEEVEPGNESVSIQKIYNPFDDSDLFNSSYQMNLKNFKSSPQSILTPIHTKEQLDALMAEDREKLALSRLDTRFFYYHKSMRTSPLNESPFETSMQSSNLVDDNDSSLKIADDGRIYMVSPNSESRGDDDEVLDFRAQLNESRESMTGRRGSVNRRRRSVSPEQHPSLGEQAQAATTGLEEFSPLEIEGSMLNEVQMNLCEPRLRIWIVRTILQPILKAISETNQELSKSFAGLHLRIGVSTLEALRVALKTNNRLGVTKLPFLLPFLEVEENQAYLVARISQLGADSFMDDYKWNGGGTISKAGTDVDQKATSRLLPPGWQQPLITDAQLIFKLFTSYMDSMIASSTFTHNHLNRPFTSRYILDLKDNRLQAYQSISAEYYFRMTTQNPPHIDFIYVSEMGRPVRLPIQPGPQNLFRSILSFIHHIKVYYDSTVSQVEMGRSGINLECVIDVD
ncbi:unnamed protein product, partial [Mesorhabditis belari]|uniref:Transmembrane protein 209 n=1 Tax=Mesorhabditis belari TaxID=2138241 RepID=A0AAF3E9X1_9BILA